jgi:hypothetical protein
MPLTPLLMPPHYAIAFIFDITIDISSFSSPAIFAISFSR